MSVFVVIARDNPETVKAALIEHYADSHHEFSSNSWFVHDISSPTTREVSTKLKIKGGESGAQAAVIALTAYSGWATKSIWDWMSKWPEAKPDG